jgi:hypothetical protein
MKQLHLLSTFLSAVVITTASLPALAQQAAAAPMPEMAASMPMDCAKPAVKRHNHGAERGLPVSASKSTGTSCAHESAAPASASTAKKKLAHDHAKFHKNQ